MHPINIRFNSDSFSLSQLNERLSKCSSHSLGGLGVQVEEGVLLTSLTFQQFKASLTPFLRSFAATCSESDLNEFKTLATNLFSEQAGSSSGRTEVDDIVRKIKEMQNLFKPSTPKAPLSTVPTFGTDMYRHLFSFLSSPAEKVAFLFSYEMAHYQEISWEEAISRASQLWTTLSSHDISALANILPGAQSSAMKRQTVLNALRLQNVTQLSFSSLPDHEITLEDFNLLASKCPALENLSFFGCGWVTSVLSDSTPMFNRLKQLNLSMSGISEKALNLLLQKSPLLEILNLRYCRSITEEALNGVLLDHLEELHLGSSNVTEKELEVLLQMCPKLTFLDLSSCKSIYKKPLKGIPLLPHLRDINLEDCNLGAENFSILLKACHHLKKLDLRGVRVSTGIVLSVLSPSTELEELYIHTYLLEEEFNTLLQNHSKLRKLSVSLSRSTTGESLENLPNLMQLEEIEIDGPGITDTGFETLLRKYPCVKNISLRYSPMMTGETVRNTPPFEQVEHLYIENSQITAKGFGNMLQKFPKLQTLDFSSKERLSHESFKNIPLLSHLTQLSLRNTNGFGDECLSTLLSLCPKLKFFNLISCQSTTGRFLSGIPLLSDLEAIYLQDSSFTNQGLMDLLIKSPNLKNLRLVSCPSITEEFSKKTPFLAHLEKTAIERL